MDKRLYLARSRSNSPVKSPMRSPMKRSSAAGSSKVKVAVRVRPVNGGDAGDIRVSENELTVFPSSQLVASTSRQIEPRTFAFDRCFASGDSQQCLYNQFGEEFLTHALEGYNACIFAYGQTGSGKSYTMLGSDEQPGVIPQLCGDLFERLEKLVATTATTVRLSFLEVYNEQIHDLLGDMGTNLRLRADDSGTYVEGLSEYSVKNVQAVIAYLQQGAKNRATASTKMNDQSSRSHAVVTLQIKQQAVSADSNGVSEEKISQLRLVDLAGSERATATGATGDRLREGGNINKSLVTLGRVISTLAEKPGSMAPYRDSILTRLLQDSLGGNSRTAMIACISPEVSSYEQSLSTLRYADQAKNITTRARINQDIVSSDAQAVRLATMERELNVLRQQLSSQTSSTDSNVTSTGNEDLGQKFAAFARFYEDEAARQQTRCRALEMQKASIEKQNEQLIDYLRELSGKGLSSLEETQTHFANYEQLESAHRDVLNSVVSCKQELNQSGLKWREIMAKY